MRPQDWSADILADLAKHFYEFYLKCFKVYCESLLETPHSEDLVYEDKCDDRGRETTISIKIETIGRPDSPAIDQYSPGTNC